MRPRSALIMLSLIFFLGSCPFLASSNNRDLGGTTADKSYIERKLSGIAEGFRFIQKAFDGGGEEESSYYKRPPKKVELAMVGFGRTGTTSIVSALHILGYTVLHDDTLGEASDLHAKLAAKENPLLMDGFVDQCGERGFDAIFYCSDDFLEWAARTDHAKVLLTKRDSAKKWAESWLNIAPMADYLESRPFIWAQVVRDILPGYVQVIYKQAPTMGQPEKYLDQETLEKGYEAHLEKVRRMIPSDRLLEYNVKEGWEPLCNFLGKPIPAIDFPHVNDRVVVQGIVWAHWLVTWIWPLGPLLGIYLVCSLTWLIFGGNNNVKKTTTAGKKRN